jgi:hypothetical protein
VGCTVVSGWFGAAYSVSACSSYSSFSSIT